MPPSTSALQARAATPKASLRVRGELGRRIALTARQLTDRSTYTPELLVQDLVHDPQHQRTADDYSGDLSGRYLEAVKLANDLGFTPDWELLDEVLSTALTAQRRDGSFGRRDAGLGVMDHGQIWGNGMLLTGLHATLALLQERDSPLAGRAAAVEEAYDRLVDHVVTSVPDWLRWFETRARQHKFALDFLACLPPLVDAALRSDSPRVAAAAGALADAVPAPSAPWHLHGYLLALRGKLAYTVAFERGRRLPEIYRDWLTIRQDYVLPYGGVRESMREPKDMNTEGCGIADWIMLSSELARSAKMPSLLDVAEVALYNALFHVQRPNGHFGCETLTDDDGLLTVDYCPEAWWCCTMHGFKAMHHIATHAVELQANSVVEVSHLVPLSLSVDGHELVVATAYPFGRDFTVELTGQLPATTWRLRTSAHWEVDGGIGRFGEGFYEAGSAEVEVRGRLNDWVESDGLEIRSLELNGTDESSPLHGHGGSLFRGPLVQCATTTASPAGDVVTSRSALVFSDGAVLSVTDEDDRLVLRGVERGFLLDAQSMATTTWTGDSDRNVVTRFGFHRVVPARPDHSVF